MESTAIYTIGDRTLIKVIKAGWLEEWVVGYNYRENEKEGNKWDCGIYFTNFIEAVRFLTRSIPRKIWILTTEWKGEKQLKIITKKEDAFEEANKFIEKITGQRVKPFNDSTNIWDDLVEKVTNKKAPNEDSTETVEWEDKKRELFVYVTPYDVIDEKWEKVGEVANKGNLYLSNNY